VGRTARIGEAGTSCSLVCTEEDKNLLKTILKRAKKNNDIVKHRIVSDEAKILWNKRIEKLFPKLKDLERKDLEIRTLKKANMEFNKIENRLAHEQDILNRPARVWFQSEKQKRNVKGKF
jgi:ATP-dependent RNA helicase DDX27